MLTAPEFAGLAEVPPEVEWFENITNRQTRRAYRSDIADFMRFAGIRKPEEFRIVVRAHVIAWRKSLEAQELGPAPREQRNNALLRKRLRDDPLLGGWCM